MHLFHKNIDILKLKKLRKWVLLCCTVGGYKCVTVMDGFEFEFNNIISLYTKNNSERRQSVSLYDIILLSILIDDIIVNKVIYYTLNLILNDPSLAIKIEHFIRF